jgi:DNA end-binding protein Ku
MARAFWKGSIRFGLVEIPVALRPALQSEGLDFTLLDRADFNPVGYRRYNKKTGQEVPWDRVIRGYQHAPDAYVVLSDEELRSANVEATQAIDIAEFVEGSEIDPVFFDTPYYVEPLRKTSKSYALLRATLERTGKVGIAQVVLRTRQHLAALRARDRVLVLELLRYDDEIVPPREVEVPRGQKEAGISDAEIRMAERLVGEMTATWKPEAFRDDYRDDVLELVRRKVKSGQSHTIVEPRDAGAEKRPRREVVDLMPLLERSLESRSRPARRPAARVRRPRAGARPRSRRSA